MTRTLVASGRVAVSPGFHSTLVPSASASLSTGGNGGDGIGLLVSPLARCPGAARCPSIDPQGAALSTGSDRPSGAARRLNSPVKAVTSGMLLALASVMLHRAYARSAQRLARRDGGGGRRSRPGSRDDPARLDRTARPSAAATFGAGQLRARP